MADYTEKPKPDPYTDAARGHLDAYLIALDDQEREEALLNLAESDLAVLEVVVKLALQARA